MENLIESKADIVLRIDGENEIGASELAVIIGCISNLAEIVAKNEEPHSSIKITVKTFSEGSFQVNFGAVYKVYETLLTQTIPLAGLALTVVHILKGCFEMKSHVKGRKPKKIQEIDGDMVEIENADGEKLPIPKKSIQTLDNINAQRQIEDITKIVKTHNSEGGFSIGTPSSQAQFTSDNVSEMCKSIAVEEDIHVKRYSTQERLAIKAPIFYGGGKWSLILKGRTIHATIEDEAFLEEFQKSGSVKAHDFLNVTLRAEVEYDKSGELDYTTAKYFVDEVHGGVQHDYVQQSIFN
jgi:hypothetical protein